MLDTHVRNCCAADATEAEIEAEARRAKKLADKATDNNNAVKATCVDTQQAEEQPQQQKQKQKQKRKRQSKQAIDAKESQLQIPRETQSQHENTELDVYDFPGDMPTELRVKTSSSSTARETATVNAATVRELESSAPLTHGTTPRQSKQDARLRRLIENGDHELGQNDEAEVRLRRLESSFALYRYGLYVRYPQLLKEKSRLNNAVKHVLQLFRAARSHSSSCIQTHVTMSLGRQSKQAAAPTERRKIPPKGPGATLALIQTLS
jgi:hypothetical protein